MLWLLKKMFWKHLLENISNNLNKMPDKKDYFDRIDYEYISFINIHALVSVEVFFLGN